MIYVNNKKITFAFLERKLEPPTTDQNYLYFQAADNIGFVSMKTPADWTTVFEISTDGETWNIWNKTANNGFYEFETIVLPHFGAYVLIRCVSGTIVTTSTTHHIYFSFNSPYEDGNAPKISAGGNIMLLDPSMSSTSVRGYWLYNAFYGCTSLITPPELPATSVGFRSYSGLFHGCSSLLYCPELPATTLDERCYESMFSLCSSLTIPPELPATTLKQYCYTSMFYGCHSLTTAPELPATTAAASCYSSMFRECISLQTAPELPATTLSGSCYFYMFRDCTSLQTAPELPAQTLVTSCYSYMFEHCDSLSYIKLGATSWPSDTSTTSPTYHWVNGVSTSGTFYKRNITIPVGISGIPEGWTPITY